MMKLVKNKIKINNGEEIAYLRIGKGKKVVVWVHGNYSSSCHYLPVFERIKDEYTFIAPDLRGFGDSSYNNSFNSLDELALDLAAFLDELKIKNVPVVGWSLGGGVCLKLAALRPDLVSKLVLIEGASHKGYPVFRKDRDYHSIFGECYETKDEVANDPVQVTPALVNFKNKNKAFFDMIYTATMWNINKPTNPQELDLYLEETMKERCLVDAVWALCNFNMSNLSNGYSIGSNDIDKVVCPTLITWAKKDLVVYEHMIRDNLDALKDASLVTYDNVGHSVITDIPDQLMEDVYKFID